jgi:hypothetical protein
VVDWVEKEMAVTAKNRIMTPQTQACSPVIVLTCEYRYSNICQIARHEDAWGSGNLDPLIFRSPLDE